MLGIDSNMIIKRTSLWQPDKCSCIVTYKLAFNKKKEMDFIADIEFVRKCRNHRFLDHPLDIFVTLSKSENKDLNKRISKYYLNDEQRI